MVKGGITFQIRSKIEKSVKGGFIAFQIRRVITESVKEAAAYGEIERKLYDMLIYNASKICKVQKKTEKKEEEEEELLKQLFLCRNEKYNSLSKDEKKFYDEKYNSLPLKQEIFDEYKKVLENKFLIIGSSVQNEKGKLGKIVKVDEVDNDKSYYITIEGRGHGINKSFRVDNPARGSNSSEREEHWLKSLLDWRHWRHHSKIPLEPLKIENWEYAEEVKLEKDYSKRIDDKEK